MEERKPMNFTRLLSDESTQSDLSTDSCEYHQTEIFDQLPSIQACRPELSRLGGFEAAQGGPEPEDRLSNVHLSRGSRDKALMQPLRNRAICMQAKRSIRERRKKQINNTGESWRRSQSISRKRLSASVAAALSSLLPWRNSLHTIEGKFGVGVKSYFVFLRYLVYMNLLHCALIFGFILGPTIFYGRGESNETMRFGGNDSVLDFFLGTGYLDRSPVFFGFYTPGSLNLACLNTTLLYLAAILTIFLLSLVMVVRRTVVGYKHTWMLGTRYSMNVSFKIFCSWDFTVQDPAAADLKRSFIRNDLKLLLEEQSFSLREARRTLGQKVRLYLLRFILNLLVLCLLGGAFYLIFFITEISMKQTGHNWLISLFFEYLPPSTITIVNLFLPHIFRKISSFEDYSFTTQVNATLVRSIFLKLASLGIYLFFVLKSTHSQSDSRCRENQFGREMYTLTIFNFLETVCNAFLWDYPRKLLQERSPTSWLIRLVGKQRFLIHFEVLDLVHSQTVFWVGVYYCPLLPLIGMVALVITFYLKKFSVLRCCEAEHRVFRGSNSSVLFHFMLLLGLTIAGATLAFNVYQQDSMTHTLPCGPFAMGESAFTVMEGCVNTLPSPVQTTLSYVASATFALPLILAEIVILTSYVSRGRSNQKAIERLKELLVTTSTDKRFLVKKHTTMLRSKRKARSAVTEEDPSPCI
ncbi:transmembrane channel-like protein 7 [Mugil cephalus]|uniref:transmembrane channel-like protein 7 n=1 Tax=Mugil cephalus TaxID=48193 RepID=UPI001FB7C599|nr:transmembrane channel-like protein 7 [Mugil cephalus]